MASESFRPWIVTDPVTVSVDDPLLLPFSLQHDFRERFFNALQEIVALKVEGRSYKAAFEKALAIATEALDEDSIMAWMDAGRPLPGIDAEFGEVPRHLNDEVSKVLDRMVRADKGAGT